MAYDTYLEERITRVLEEKNVVFIAKKMMGGLCYMVDDKMCVGIVKEQVMARIGTDFYSEALIITHVNEMNFTGKTMKGYVYIDDEGVDTEEQLEFWVQKCLDFNPLARSSKKKKK